MPKDKRYQVEGRFVALDLLCPPEKFQSLVQYFWSNFKNENFEYAKKVLFRLLTCHLQKPQLEVLYGIICYLKHKYKKRIDWKQFGKFPYIDSIQIEEYLASGRTDHLVRNPFINYMNRLTMESKKYLVRENEVELYQQTRNPYFAQQNQVDPNDAFLVERDFVLFPSLQKSMRLLKLNPMHKLALMYIIENGNELDQDVVHKFVCEYILNEGDDSIWEFLYKHRINVKDKMITSYYSSNPDVFIQGVINDDFPEQVVELQSEKVEDVDQIEEFEGFLAEQLENEDENEEIKSTELMEGEQDLSD